MAIIICTLPHASTSINGVKFSSDRGQMISEDVSDDVAAHFARIRGFKIANTKTASTTTAK